MKFCDAKFLPSPLFVVFLNTFCLFWNIFRAFVILYIVGIYLSIWRIMKIFDKNSEFCNVIEVDEDDLKDAKLSAADLGYRKE